MSSKRISFKVEGEVQGVNFRPRSSFTVKQANNVGVTGYVKNASDGSVQGEAQGNESSLKKFVEHLNKGPSAADVNKVETSEIEPKQGRAGSHSSGRA
ncbi:hypothetical protein H2199_000660 [Coniosporium tulheliwenetii]|uniref:Uncharacterized protein n=1 Tax=Coniosporium tulheliwenetii TaxID=3383036 RepID=A0ACC2ZML9_9PEZI|nr:hypothetical protein H2199_000660 [Cladosporium sp. JES 115]